MDDLISRKAAIESVDRIKTCTINDKFMSVSDMILCFAQQQIENVPSVPAVPLDKLCEWLGKHYAPCQLMDDCDSPCMLEGVGQMPSAECWYYLIRTKVMGESDGGDADDHG